MQRAVSFIFVSALAAVSLTACDTPWSSAGLDDVEQVEEVRPLPAQTSAAFTSTPAAPTEHLSESDYRHTVKVGKRDREYLQFAPENAAGEALPLIIAFHGHTSSAENFYKHSHFERARAVVVYPDGVAKKIQKYPEPKQAWAPAWYAGTTPEEDVEFVDAIIAQASKEYDIDPDRIYITGFSNGGGFAAYLAATYPEKFAAAAIAGAAVRTPEEELRTGLPIPLLMMHGTDDKKVYTTGYTSPIPEPPGGTDVVLPVEEVLEAFRVRNGNDGVEYVEITGWGHAWATADTKVSFDTTGRVIEFFGIEDTHVQLPDFD